MQGFKCLIYSQSEHVDFYNLMKIAAVDQHDGLLGSDFDKINWEQIFWFKMCSISLFPKKVK